MTLSKCSVLLIAAALMGPSAAGSAPGDEADVVRVAVDNTYFAFDLYHELCQGDGNLLLSPYSISQALAMTYSGARAQTQQQMAAVLHFETDSARLHRAFHALDGQLHDRGQGARGRDGAGFQLHIANALWAQKGFQFQDEFTQGVQHNYRAGLNAVDFGGNPETARMTINDWVAKRTAGKIRDLFGPGAITSDNRLVLTNAIYFNAAWQHQFNPKQTREDDFHPLTGGVVRVPMMSQTTQFGYAEAPKIQVVELPYEGEELSMVLLVPARGSFSNAEQSWSAASLNRLLGELRPARVRLTMPRFEYTTRVQLKPTLMAMGMTDAFDCNAADFSGMTDQAKLNIDTVVHQAYILVDEAGTEAAAATGVGMMITSVPPPPVVVKIDRPFMYLIRDKSTGTILFMGRLMKPT